MRFTCSNPPKYVHYSCKNLKFLKTTIELSGIPKSKTSRNILLATALLTGILSSVPR